MHDTAVDRAPLSVIFLFEARNLMTLRFINVVVVVDRRVLIFVFNHAADDRSILHGIMHDTAVDRAPLSVIFLFEAVNLVLLHAVNHIIAADRSILHAVHYFARFDLRLLHAVNHIVAADCSILHAVHYFACFDLRLLHAVNHVVAADRSILHAVHYFARFDLRLLHAVNHVVAVDGSPLAVIHRILLVVFDCALIKSLFQIFDSRTILFNLFILPSFMFRIFNCNFRKIKAWEANLGCLGCHAAHREKHACDKCCGDETFQGFPCDLMAAHRVIAVNEFGAHHVAAARGVPYDFVDSVHLRFPFSLC